MLNEFENYRSKLFSIAYRMTGSAMEAEDLVQETYLRYQNADLQTVRSPQAFLTTIITRLSINHLNSARVQRETHLGPWLPEPILTAADQAISNPADHVSAVETLSLSFMTLLEKLTPAERAVFLLREVFDYHYAEIATILGKTEAACRKLGARAKQHIRDNRPRFEASPEEHAQLLESFLQASRAGDVNALMNLLSSDVQLIPDGGESRGRATRIVQGNHAVAVFIVQLSRFYPPGLRSTIANVNGKPALLVRTAEGHAFAVITIEAHQGKIMEIHALANPDKLRHL